MICLIQVGNPGQKSESKIRVGNPGRKFSSEIRIGNSGRKSGSKIGGKLSRCKKMMGLGFISFEKAFSRKQTKKPMNCHRSLETF
jgi:hypothetical protein